MVYDRYKATPRERGIMAKYDIDVQLTGRDGNAFMVMATVQQALRRAGVADDELDKYFEEATAGDYNQLLSTTTKWVNVY